jgi:serine/threonine-protein kinase RsbT
MRAVADRTRDARSVTERIRSVLLGHVSTITAESVLKSALSRIGRSTADVDRDGVDDLVIAELDRGLSVFVGSESERRDSLEKLRGITQALGVVSMPSLVEIPIVDEAGVVDARTAARTFARDVGFGRVDQAKIATSVSELARNIYAYAKTGRIVLSSVETPRTGVKIVAIDTGPGIPNLTEILDGNYRSRTGMGLGILGCKRLMDEFTIESVQGRGTTISLVKYVA